VQMEIRDKVMYERKLKKKIESFRL
jgi:hypothetical protein